MPDLIHVQYSATGESTSVNPMRMREMQARAYAARAAQYLLLKAPPAKISFHFNLFEINEINHGENR